MPSAASERLRPWIGSVIVHGVIVAVLALAAVQWRADPEPEQLAIEGNVVRYEDLPSSVKAGRPLRETAPVPEPAPQPTPRPTPEPEPVVQPQPAVAPEPDPALAQQQAQAAAKAQADAKARAEAAAVRLETERSQAAAKQARDAAALAAKERAAAEDQRKQEEQRKQAATEAKLKQAEQEKAAAAARAKAAKQADLQRALEDEEAGEALARSGVVDEYRTLLIQTIERNWNRPATARPGLECTLNVTQATGGTVLDVKIGDCNGDQAVRESVANAVYRSSPLPAPRDARAFERRLVIVFKPTE
jgi:colicin import membrane protein